MAVYTEQKRRYQFLHRFMSGLTVSCIVVTIIGGWIADNPAGWIAFWAAVVAVGLMIAEFIIIKVWASWEEVQHGLGRRA